MTIVEAIKQVMYRRGAPMTVAEVYGAIIDQGLYTFNADQPEQIVRQQIRRHCQGIDVPSARATKHFFIHGDGTYTALPRAIKQQIVQRGGMRASRLDDPAANLRAMHADYVEEFRGRLIRQLHALEPAKFELFGIVLLDGHSIANLMMEKRFGVEVETLPIFSNALDNAMSDGAEPPDG